MSATSARIAEQSRIARNRVAHSDIPIPKDRNRTIDRPPGPSGLRFVSQFLRGGSALAFLDDVGRDYPRIAHMRLMGEHLYVLTHPDTIVEIMHTHGRDTMKGRGLQAAKAVLGNGLLTSEGEVHMRQRRLVQPAFHRDRLHGYAQQMVAAAARRADHWRDNQTLDMSDAMAELTFDIVGRTLFGSDLRGDAADVGAALDEVIGGLGQRLILGPVILRLPTPGRRAALAASATLDSVVQRMIDQHRSAEADTDILGMLIAAQEDGAGMSDEQVRDEVMTLVLAGHETTAMTLSWTWLLLAQHPAQRQWLQEELDQILGSRVPTFDDYARLHRTRAVIAESLRLYPPAWVMGRRLLADIEVDGWRVPRGATTLASPWITHRDPRWWNNARTFSPSRWLDNDGSFDEAAPGQPRGAWFSFGWGNRRCIGEAFAWMEATLVLATLAQRWQAELVPGQAITTTPGVTLRPEPGIPMTLHSH